MSMEYLPVSWNEYIVLAQNLAASLLKNEGPFDEIVAIARGGLTLGHLLSDHLHLPICSITIQSYTDIQKQGELQITAKLGRHITGKRILLVDDIADSGKTLKRAVNYLRRFKPSSITTATMFYKPHSIFHPDYFIQETKKWVIFPTEITETLTLLQGKMSKEKLLSLGFTQKQISFANDHS
ncbi:hypothetical protein A3A79_03210 [Candidatus Gottesmanbacteria bacterium RIFCSPLOWO2_01_FULL_43_11b]|uniref:Phosphoribosyltransferase domain-containing protein n=1 Tax=Candidatus Gottesmanbacteria bacterium RIFCSPLOWO2_01_FULL_43_11b TaxID=1798392 RepID=A0A1F6AHI0_9BACT|nr:MAG: hypothetical protein A3A79_03210 [Candidatus Gottesmanbacteria bacterium RIFCSPLOWO2_01_FULL_43_11b]